MIEIPSLRPETRYGMPTADQVLFNRKYIIGYSYLLRQAKWAMEVIDPDNKPILVEREDRFRADLRIPPQFRADLADYQKSDHDRGHLISSADRRSSEILNSETFLLTNMSPQKGGLNRKIWKDLEEAVRLLAFSFVEVYAICGPIFAIGREIKVIGDKMNDADKNDVVIPVPHFYFKSVLAESLSGSLTLWSFIIENKQQDEEADGTKIPWEPLVNYLVPTTEIERRAGLTLWDRLRGVRMEKMKAKKGSSRAFEKAVSEGRQADARKKKNRKALAEELGLEELGRATEILDENPKLADLVRALKTSGEA